MYNDSSATELLWKGKVAAGGERITKGSTISGSIPIGTIPCKGGGISSAFGNSIKVGMIDTVQSTNRIKDGKIIIDDGRFSNIAYEISYDISFSCCGKIFRDDISIKPTKAINDARRAQRMFEEHLRPIKHSDVYSYGKLVE